MSIVSEIPDMAFLKGGLFVKSDIELPSPGRQVFMARAEKWEKPYEGIETMD